MGRMTGIELLSLCCSIDPAIQWSLAFLFRWPLLLLESCHKLCSGRSRPGLPLWWVYPLPCCPRFRCVLLPTCQCITQFSADRCRTLSLISSTSLLWIEWFLSASIVTLLSVYIATILSVCSLSLGSCSSAFRTAICSAWLLEQQFCSLYLHCAASCIFEYMTTPALTLPSSLLPSV